MKEHAEALRIALEKVQAVTTRFLMPEGISAEQAMNEILALTDNAELTGHQMALLNYAPPRAKLVLDLTGGCLQDLCCTVPVDVLQISHDRDDVEDATPLEQIPGSLRHFGSWMRLTDGDGDGVAVFYEADSGHATEAAAEEWHSLLNVT